MRVSHQCESCTAVARAFLIALLAGLCLSASQGFSNSGQNENLPSPASPVLPTLPELRSGTKIVADLQTSLDVLATKSGDEVVARVTKNVKRKGRIIIHKGDFLLGRVNRVRPQQVGQGKEGSEIAVTFDRLTSGDETFRLNTVIRSLVWFPGHRRSRWGGMDDKYPSALRGMALRPPTIAPGGVTGATQLPAASGVLGPRPVPGIPRPLGGAGLADRQAISGVSDPRSGLLQSGSLQASPRPAVDSRKDVVTVLRDPLGNLRLKAGTRLNFRIRNR